MKQELIKDNMTSAVVSIAANASLEEAHKLMTAKGIRRLPVVDGGKVTGIVSLSDVLEAKPSDATSLSIWELNYLIANLHIKDIMSENPLSLAPNDSIVDAAKIMLKNKIGGIPVTENGKLVGIITESDIFRLVVREWA